MLQVLAAGLSCEDFLFQVALFLQLVLDESFTFMQPAVSITDALVTEGARVVDLLLKAVLSDLEVPGLVRLGFELSLQLRDLHVLLVQLAFDQDSLVQFGLDLTPGVCLALQALLHLDQALSQVLHLLSFDLPVVHGLLKLLLEAVGVLLGGETTFENPVDLLHDLLLEIKVGGLLAPRGRGQGSLGVPALHLGLWCSRRLHGLPALTALTPVAHGGHQR
mmetsp:Transcript_69884/g.166774  ORF Transcript_69884/g.166774 Transcript_69884/m.166774 type:complete len:220 (-) Transcript_69884:591-1250(-)